MRATISPAYVSVKDAATYAACSVDTIRRLIAKNQLRAYRFAGSIRIKIEDLERAAVPVTNAPMLRGDADV